MHILGCVCSLDVLIQSRQIILYLASLGRHSNNVLQHVYLALDQSLYTWHKADVNTRLLDRVSDF